MLRARRRRPVDPGPTVELRFSDPAAADEAFVQWLIWLLEQPTPD
jgi:hypothetical protein